MAYIDSALAARRTEASQAPHTHTHTSSSSNHQSMRDVGPTVQQAQRKNEEKETQRQPASLGKLQEIDLGEEARDRNVVQTERARRRLDGEVVEEEGEGEVKKVRVGPDGKPWRGRKRRGSEDVKRDRMVEDVLRENRCTSLPQAFSFSWLCFCLGWA
jgi:hypothetical protein